MCSFSAYDIYLGLTTVDIEKEFHLSNGVSEQKEKTERQVITHHSSSLNDFAQSSLFSSCWLGFVFTSYKYISSPYNPPPQKRMATLNSFQGGCHRCCSYGKGSTITGGDILDKKYYLPYLLTLVGDRKVAKLADGDVASVPATLSSTWKPMAPLLYGPCHSIPGLEV